MFKWFFGNLYSFMTAAVFLFAAGLAVVNENNEELLLSPVCGLFWPLFLIYVFVYGVS